MMPPLQKVSAVQDNQKGSSFAPAVGLRLWPPPFASAARCFGLAFLVACGGTSEPGVEMGPTNVLPDPCDVLNFKGAANSAYSAAGVMTVSPIPLASIASIIPLGNLNAPIHVYPTDHMYILPMNPTAGANTVVAAAAGKILQLYQPSGADWKVLIKLDTSFYYYYDHITPEAGLAVGQPITAGQTVGTNSGQAAAVDFGVYNFNNPPLTGILNACSLEASGQADSPLKYFSGTLQSSLYAKVNTSGAATKDGKIDYDQDGKLVGNWVLTGHKPVESPDYQLAFTHNVLTHALRVSMGKQLGGGGTFGIQSGAADFATITTASGQVNYQLFSTGSGDSSQPSTTQFGVLAVQMLANSQVKVEVFPGAGTIGVFDGGAVTYVR